MADELIHLIYERYQHVNNRIAEANALSENAATSVRLVVVTKSQPIGVVRAAIAAGITTFGENYVAEAVEKIAALEGSGVEWHMIGHIQSRKAEMVVRNFNMIHSVDSLKLARRLDGICKDINRTMSVLLEFNVSGEESKFGLAAWEEKDWPSLLPEIEEMLTLGHLQISGLMTMPPYFDDPEKTRPTFRKLRRLQEFMKDHFPQTEWSELSMGTSVDYITAVQEGATYVRIGEAILGPRQK
jgi:pyridoxal phosphate enzyme (YggS family)